MKKRNKIFLGIIIILGIMQLFGPTKNIGSEDDLATFINETQPSAEVQVLLKNSCYDCHSSKTEYAWYNNITPINYWVNHHIEEGKEELNFSEWGTYSIKKKKHKMKEISEEVEEKHMPISSYLIMHGDADLSDAEIKLIEDWAKAYSD